MSCHLYRAAVGEIILYSLPGCLGVSALQVGVGENSVDGSGIGPDIVEGHLLTGNTLDVHPVDSGALDVESHWHASAVHGLGEGYAEGLLLGYARKSEDVGSMVVAAQVVVADLAEEDYPVVAGSEGFQPFGLGPASGNEYAAVAGNIM